MRRFVDVLVLAASAVAFAVLRWPAMAVAGTGGQSVAELRAQRTR